MMGTASIAPSSSGVMDGISCRSRSSGGNRQECVEVDTSDGDDGSTRKRRLKATRKELEAKVM